MQIFVLGMHRSGTSLVARLVNLMGAYFGGEGMALAPNAENPKGFWERRDVIAINDRLLSAQDSTWYDIYPLISSSAGTDRPDGREAAALVTELDAHRPWFIKDPRLCLTLPNWTRTCEVPIAVVCLRDIATIANSLSRRGPIAGAHYSSDEALALCKAYLATLVSHVRGLPRIVIRYEKLLTAPWDETKRFHDELVALKLGTGLRLPSRAEVERFVDASLQRSHVDSTLLSMNEEVEAALAGETEGLSHWLDDDCLGHLEAVRVRRRALENARADHAARTATLIERLAVPAARREIARIGQANEHWSLARLRSLLKD
jgi:hypothetical protein